MTRLASGFLSFQDISLSPAPSETIFDIGMHLGEDSAFYLAKGFRVIAVEANPQLIAHCEEKFAREIANGQLIIVGAGIGRDVGVMPFYVNAMRSEWSSFDEEFGSRGGCREIIDVPVITMADLIENFQTPYFIKIDIEGHDQMAIESLAQTHARPRYISVENGHPHMVDMFARMGYDAFKFVNQKPIPGSHNTRPSREGKDIDWIFPVHASGPFGEETPGVWKRRDDVLVEIKAYWSNPHRDANIHGWYDLHARLSQRG